MRAFLLGYAILGVFVFVPIVALGISMLLRGSLTGLSAVLIPFAMAAFFIGFNIAGLRSLERDIPGLVQVVKGVLDSGAAVV